MSRLNARHPWSHNEHFHSWIVSRLPERRRRALDVGCGRGELLAVLSPGFDQVRGTDLDAEMRRAARDRCAGLPNVQVDGTALTDLDGRFDVVTMIAVLHHLDVEKALHDVTRLLSPGGRFLCVGLALPQSGLDHAWDVASIVTNPLIGWVKHPWVATGPPMPWVPVKDPRVTFREVGSCAERVMPGVEMRRRLAFRHTLEWTKR